MITGHWHHVHAPAPADPFGPRNVIKRTSRLAFIGIVTRVFEASLLRDEGGGGDRYWAKQQHKWRKWDQGFIRECWNWKVRTRSAKRSKRSGVSLRKLHRRAVDLGVESKIGATGIQKLLGAWL